MKRITPWFVGTLLSTLLLAGLAVFAGLRYAGTGDALILKLFAGYQGGVPAYYHAQLHTALAWLLCGLHTLVPTIAWFSVIQLLCLWLSGAILVKSMTQCALHHKLPWWLGTVLGGLLLLSFGLFAMCRVSHTATAALLGMAAAAQCFSIDFSHTTDRQVLAKLAPSIGLLLTAYCFDQWAGLAALSFWLLLVLAVRLTSYSPKEIAAKGTKARHGFRGLLLAVCLCSFCFLLFAAIRTMELNAMGDYAAWQHAWGRLSQNAGFPNRVDGAMLETLGWTPNKLKLIADGFLYDTEITAESLLQCDALLNAGAGMGRGATLGMQAKNALTAMALAQGELLPVAAVPLGFMLLCLIAAAVKHSRKRCAWLLPIAAVLLGLLWLGVLAQTGLQHAHSWAALAPVAALLCGSFLSGLAPAEGVEQANKADKPPKLQWVLLCLTCAAFTLPCLMSSVRGIVQLPIRAQSAAFEQQLESYALENPEQLIFYQPSHARDTRMFPNLSTVPHNIVLPDVRNARTPGLTNQMEQFQIDANRMTMRDLLKKQVRVAGTDKGPWRTILPYAQEREKGTWNWARLEQNGDVCLYRLCKR
ncbi:MAG: hypothetical protein RR946_08145 [Clostridia bacterium]